MKSAPAPDAPKGTRSGLLDAAERLFSIHGVEGTSVRQIIAAAGANLAAVNYHFGAKNRLVLEVFARRLQPVNRERIERLDKLEATAGRGKLKLEDIVEALVCPALETSDDGAAHHDDLMRLLSRCFQEPNPELKKFVEDQFAEVAGRFNAAILRALPELSPADLFWRMSFVFGALHHGQERWLRFDQMPQPCGDFPRPNRAEFIRYFISFATAGLSAPARKGR